MIERISTLYKVQKVVKYCARTKFLRNYGLILHILVHKKGIDTMGKKVVNFGAKRTHSKK